MRAMVPNARRAVIPLALSFAFALPFSLAFASPLVPLRAQPPDVPFPTTNWPTGPLPAGVDAAKLEELLSVVKAAQPELGETRAVVVVQRGRIVAERYMPGFTAETRLLSWSMAKSVTQALVGIAVRLGLVDPDQPMGNPRWAASDERNKIPWRLWLNMADGQDYHEIGVVNQTKNDAARMLYGEGRLDVAGFGVGLPLIHPPGTHWNYNSAGINLIADALGRAFAPGQGPAQRRDKVARVLHDELFGPLGMTSAQPEFDAAGTFIGSALVYATARDWARFGLLYARDGLWDGKRILPPGWVDFARTKTPAPDCDVYGAGFWVTPQEGRGKPYEALTPEVHDFFTAEGHEGQLVSIVPSKDLVIVRLGHLYDPDGFTPLGAWMQRLILLFPDVPPT
jgi:CubicO group peptidase (beta-lactamase class C family)